MCLHNLQYLTSRCDPRGVNTCRDSIVDSLSSDFESICHCCLPPLLPDCAPNNSGRPAETGVLSFKGETAQSQEWLEGL